MRIQPTSICIDTARHPAYDRAMRKHTTIDLDANLVREAAGVLGTTRTTDTIHAALAEVVNQRRRLSLLSIDNTLELADLAEIRAHRFAERPETYGSNAGE